MKRTVLFCLTIFALCSCTKDATKPTQITTADLGTLDVQFFINFLGDPYPTRQTVVWLEDEDANYVKTIFISAWLATGGFHHQEVCSTWNATKEWSDANIPEFDGVSGAVIAHSDIEHLEMNYNIVMGYKESSVRDRNWGALEKRLRPFAGPHVLCWARPDYRDQVLRA